MQNDLINQAEGVARIVKDAGGKLVGRTRLQKTAYLLEIMGFGEGFEFTYKHYGPYSDDLASASQLAKAMKWLDEEEHQAAWGGFYSIFNSHVEGFTSLEERRCIAVLANMSDAVELELAATAILLATQGYPDPWLETAHRKSSKAGDGKLESAKSLFASLKKLDCKNALPTL